MKWLNNILEHIDTQFVRGETALQILGFHMDSRKIESGFLFVAVKGVQVDGHRFIPKAIEQGAVAVIHQEDLERYEEGVTYIKVSDSSKALGAFANAYYDFPSTKLTLIGVTGTNGKTTMSTLLYDLFEGLGYKVGLLSTVENRIAGERIEATHTTPDAPSLQALLDRMVKEGCTHCFMEVSSHALDQKRVEGLDFDGAVFSNISHDHLDYHETMQSYIFAKKLLFDGLKASAFALVNTDDKRGRVMLQNCKAQDQLTYAVKSRADYQATIVSNAFEGLELKIGTHHAWFRMVGQFNAYNLLAVYAVAVELGEEEVNVLEVLTSLSPAAGRFDTLRNDQRNITCIVDYAHTPDALENVLSTIEDIRDGQQNIVTIVGCGGNRDREKRPKMAAVACKYSNKVIFTSDNPRDEVPEEIIKDMEAGIPVEKQAQTVSIVNREEAIKTAALLAQNDDIILIAGKGHETYQEVKGVKHDFDDKKMAQKYILN